MYVLYDCMNACMCAYVALCIGLLVHCNHISKTEVEEMVLFCFKTKYLTRHKHVLSVVSSIVDSRLMNN